MWGGGIRDALELPAGTQVTRVNNFPDMNFSSLEYRRERVISLR